MGGVIVSRHDAGQIRKHRKLTLNQPLEVGSTHEIKTSPKRSPLFHVKVMKVEPKDDRHQHHLLLVWEPEKLRLLAASPRVTGRIGDKRPKDQLPDEPEDHGYTSSPYLAMSGEPEAVPEFWQEEFSKEANAKDALRRAGNLQDRLNSEREILSGRLRALRLLATDTGADVGSDIRAIERRLDAIDAKVRRQFS